MKEPGTIKSMSEPFENVSSSDLLATPVPVEELYSDLEQMKQ